MCIAIVTQALHFDVVVLAHAARTVRNAHDYYGTSFAVHGTVRCVPTVFRGRHKRDDRPWSQPVVNGSTKSVE